MVVGAMVASACGVAGVTTISRSPRSIPSQQARSNRLRAVRVAERLLGVVVLPSRARRISPSASVARVFRAGGSLIASEVDRRAFWKTSLGLKAALAWINHHLPKPVGPGQIAEQTANGIVADAYATYSFPAIDRPFLGARQLYVEALSPPGGGSIVLADAYVRYLAPRPYDQRVPAQARVLEITVGSNLPRPLLSLKVTDASKVRRIAQIVDALPFQSHAPGPPTSCPYNQGTFPIDRFIFRATPGGAVLATVSEDSGTPTYDYPCGSTSLTIRGQHEPPLQDGGVLLKHAGELLKARLICTIKLVRVPGGPGHRSKEKVQCTVR